MGIGTACIYDGKRITASSAYLSNAPPNLTMRTSSLVSRILFDGKVASGVEVVGGQRFMARREVVLSGGAVNSPQLLMLSGIGPSKDLTQHGIEVFQDLPQVGRNLQDHCFSSAGIVLKKRDSHTEKKQSPSPMGWFKLNTVETSEELAALPVDIRAYLSKPTVPHWELATNTPFFDGEHVEEDEEVFSAICLVMNPQARGTISLASADPLDAPLIDPAFLSHPYDRRVLIEAMREMLRYFQAPVFSARTIRPLGWPESDTDEAILVSESACICCFKSHTVTEPMQTTASKLMAPMWHCGHGSRRYQCLCRFEFQGFRSGKDTSRRYERVSTDTEVSANPRPWRY